MFYSRENENDYNDHASLSPLYIYKRIYNYKIFSRKYYYLDEGVGNECMNACEEHTHTVCSFIYYYYRCPTRYNIIIIIVWYLRRNNSIYDDRIKGFKPLREGITMNKIFKTCCGGG